MSRFLLTQDPRHLPPRLIFDVRQKKMTAAAAYYLGISLPISGLWAIVVLGIGMIRDIDTRFGLAFAALVPILAVVRAALYSSSDPNGSLSRLRRESGSSTKVYFQEGFRKGIWIAPLTILGVGVLASIPIILDRVFAYFGL